MLGAAPPDGTPSQSSSERSAHCRPLPCLLRHWAGFAGRPSSRRGAGSAALAPARSRCGMPSARADSSRRAHVDPCISAASHTDIATIGCLPAFQEIGVLPTMAKLHPRLLLPHGANEASLKPGRTTLPDVLLVWTLMRLVWTLLRIAVLGSARPMHTKEVQNSSLNPKPETRNPL